MERVMSVEDKIRRAEEIYYKRREQEIPKYEHIKETRKEKKNVKLLKKMIIQIIVCLIIYSVFYIIVNNNYIFSQDFTNKAKEILSQDINFTQIYTFISNKINEIVKQPEEKQEETPSQDNESKNDIQNNNENIGGAQEILINQEQENNIVNVENREETPEIIEQTQMEKDAEYIKSTINFTKPVTGQISSIYGIRNPTTPTVPKNHTGTDIAAEIGTKIVSATDGKVILASSKGDYGNHLKIQVNDVVIVYAHCNKLYVKEGDIIKQGQEIAEVGATGNVTGPHLHFEIRCQDRYVNPQMILEL